MLNDPGGVMANTTNPVGPEPVRGPRYWRRAVAVGIVSLASVASAAGANAPIAGDYWAYRVANGYNNETRGKIQYRVEKVEADRISVLATADSPVLGGQHTVVYTPDGNWVRHPLINHGQLVDYAFAEPYPAYQFPLDPGKSWSLRVNAINPATGRKASVRVDGEVLGSERITVPAGAYDTIKVRRRTYAGDGEGQRAETNITETEWYAPALGRAVRRESNSGYMDQQRCSDEMSACTPVRGDWNIFELVEIGAPAR
jgi:hypothetical protein